MTQGNIWKQLLFFSLPLMLTNLLQQFYNTADAIIVGRFIGTDALAAVGSCGLLINCLIYFFIGLSIGGSVLVSQAYGANDRTLLSDTVHTDIALSLAAGICVAVFGFAASPTLLTIMNVPPDGLAFAIPYIRIYFIGVIPMTVYNIGSGILRAVGDSRTPLYCLAITVAINLALDLLFVGPFGWGIAGAAAATAIAQLVAAICVMWVLMRTTADYRVTLRRIRIHWDVCKHIMTIGLPAGLQSVLVCLANVVVQSQINRFGLTTMAGFTAYMKIDGFIFMPIDAFSLAISNFVGQNIGAKEFDRVNRGKNICSAMAIGVTFVIGGIVLLFSSNIIGLFSDDPAVIAVGVRQIHWVVPLYFIYAYNQVVIGALRGIGSTVVPMIISLVCMCGLRISWIFIGLSKIRDAVIIYLGYPITWIATALALTIYYWWCRHHHSAFIH